MIIDGHVVYVMTSDKYLHAIQAFSWLFNKHWGPDQRVQVVGFAQPDFEMPDNFSFMSLGPQAKYPWEKWSNGVLDLMETIPGDAIFTLMLEDYWLVRGVDVEAVGMLYGYMCEDDSVLKVDLCADRLYAANMTDFGSLGRLDLIKSCPESPYHMSMMTGLWRKSNLQKSFVPNESPHDVEITGTSRLAGIKELQVIGTRQWPVRHILAFRGGNPKATLVGGLHEDDIAELSARRYIKI